MRQLNVWFKNVENAKEYASEHGYIIVGYKVKQLVTYDKKADASATILPGVSLESVENRYYPIVEVGE